MNKPKALGWRGWSLLIPSILSAVGLFCFAVLAYSFTELQTLPTEFRRLLVVVGAFALAAGSEIGTLFAVVEIYRKGGPHTWDWLALFFSLCTTVASFVLAFAALLLRSVVWVPLLLDWGAIVLGVLAALDSYGGFMEFGLYLNSYDRRLDQWERREVAEAERRERMSQLLANDAQLPQRPHIDPDAEYAKYLEWDRCAIPAAAVRDRIRELAGRDDTSPIPSIVDDPVRNRRAALCEFWRQDPTGTQAAAAEAVGCSPSTVRNDLAALEEAGRIVRRDGKVEVL